MNLWSSRLPAALVAVSFFAATPALAAKTASPDPATVLGGICDATQSVGLCYYFLGPEHAKDTVVSLNQYACKLLRGKFKPVGARCPQANRAGRCRVKHETVDALTILYYFPRHDIAKAQADCERPAMGAQSAQVGKWVPE